MNEEKSVLFRTLSRMIERSRTDGIAKKIDVFYAANKLTEAEYQELIGMLG